jgi:hypothetical protein
LVDALLARKILGDKDLLISRGDGHQQFRAGQFGQMVLAAQGRHQQHRFIAALLVNAIRAFGHRQAGLADIGFGDRRLRVVGDLPHEVVETPDHDHRETLSRLDAFFRGPSDPRAMPLGNGNNLRHGKADRGRAGDAVGDGILHHVQTRTGGRQFDGNIGGPCVQALGHRPHAIAVARVQGVDLGADEPRTAAAGLVFRHQLLRRSGDRNLHQRFRFGFRRQIPCDHPVDVGYPQRPVFHQRQIGQKRVRGDTDSATLQAEIQLGSLG